MNEKVDLEGEGWETRRDRLTQQALDDDDLDALRSISALPGGFGSDGMRRRVWPVLLNVAHFFPEDGVSSSSNGIPPSLQMEASQETADDQTPTMDIKHSNADDPHPDEGQVLLDTKRSFVSYPKGLPPESKENMQQELYDMIVEILRKYPSLSYFQGFHDIMSVLYLTYTPLDPAPSRSTSRARRRKESGEKGETLIEEEKPRGEHTLSALRYSEEWKTMMHCAEVVSICRIRDAMGKSLEGMMGLLRILKRLLKLADPEVARFSAAISPVPTLPFFALSWILCLFSHDVDTLEPVQRMFDYLLARNPISAIYLAVAILVIKKPQMLKLAKALGSEVQNDPSLLHPLFARLPPLYPDTPDAPEPVSVAEALDLRNMDEANPYTPIALSRIFALADDLMEKYPWDGDDIGGLEIMGEGSVVYSYELEENLRDTNESYTLDEVLSLLEKEVVKPGAGNAEEEEEEEIPAPTLRRRWNLRPPRNKLGITIAIVVLGIGVAAALYSPGNSNSWRRWWASVIYRRIEKQPGLWSMFNTYRAVLNNVFTSLSDMIGR